MEEKKDYTISVRITESMYKALVKHAQEEKRYLSQYIYLILENECLQRGDITQPLFIK